MLPAAAPRRRRFAGRVAIAAAVAVVLAIVPAGAWYVYNARSARIAAGLIAEAGRLLEDGEDGRAFRLLRQAEPYMQGRCATFEEGEMGLSNAPLRRS